MVTYAFSDNIAHPITFFFYHKQILQQILEKDILSIKITMKRYRPEVSNLYLVDICFKSCFG